MCQNPKKGENWCADTLETFYQKVFIYLHTYSVYGQKHNFLLVFYLQGSFAKDHTSGFIVRHLDWDDAYNLCKCKQSFSAFYAILNGFNKAQKPASCKLFDRS